MEFVRNLRPLDVSVARLAQQQKEVTVSLAQQAWFNMPPASTMDSQFSPDTTPKGMLPPFEVAKAYAFDKALSQMQEHMGKSLWQLLGEDKGEFIAKHLELKGGGQPSRSAVFKAIRRYRETGWYPGKVTGQRTGRPPTFTQNQKEEMARVAMETKRCLEKPTPAGVRAKLPRLSLNPDTQAPASNWTIYNISTLCATTSTRTILGSTCSQHPRTSCRMA